MLLKVRRAGERERKREREGRVRVRSRKFPRFVEFFPAPVFLYFSSAL